MEAGRRPLGLDKEKLGLVAFYFQLFACYSYTVSQIC
eukprot:COSAG02_NODE_21442_length_787_cov_1.864826_2_plen_36_part_01